MYLIDCKSINLPKLQKNKYLIKFVHVIMLDSYKARSTFTVTKQH